MVSNLLKEKRVYSLFLFDKICLTSIENAEEVIKSLEDSIFYIQETIDKVRDIKNEKSEKNFTVVNINKIKALV